VCGLVHRDVEPRNVLLSWEGEVKLTDFGMAQALEEAMTLGTNVGLGTPGYLLPEQASQEELDARSEPDRKQHFAGQRTYRPRRTRFGALAGLSFWAGCGAAITEGVAGVLSTAVLTVTLFGPTLIGAVIGARQGTEYCTRCGVALGDLPTCAGVARRSLGASTAPARCPCASSSTTTDRGVRREWLVHGTCALAAGLSAVPTEPDDHAVTLGIFAEREDFSAEIPSR
jgi:hypothetical protein